MYYLLLAITFLSSCMLSQHCEEELRTIYIRMKYISYGNYEKTQYSSIDDCRADITPNDGPHYCKSAEVSVEVCK